MSPRRRRPNHIEPVHCVCEPGPHAAQVHRDPHRKGPAHLDPRCPHSTLADTTRPLPQEKKKKRRNLRLL
jgi:hypothetical protein